MIGFLFTTTIVFWGWIFFRADSLKSAVQYSNEVINSNMLNMLTGTFWDEILIVNNSPTANFAFAVLLSIIIFLRQALLKNYSTIDFVNKLSNRNAAIIMYGLSVLIMLFGNLSNQTFIYFQF